MRVTAYDLASRFIGLEELPGKSFNPAILAMLKLDQEWPQDDEVPWCGGFANYVAWLLRLPRSKDLRARSWLRVGMAIHLTEAAPGWDLVILQRGGGPQPGPEEIDAPGHVGFFAGVDGDTIHLLGGNQGNTVSVAGFPKGRVLGVRRLWQPEYDSRAS